MDKNGNTDQLADHLKPPNPLFTHNGQWAQSLQTEYQHTL